MPYFYFEGGGELGEIILQNKISSTLPRNAFDDSVRLVTGSEHPQRHPNSSGIKNLPICPLCDSDEEMDPDRTQRCQSVKDDMNNVNKNFITFIIVLGQYVSIFIESSSEPLLT